MRRRLLLRLRNWLLIKLAGESTVAINLHSLDEIDRWRNPQEDTLAHNVSTQLFVRSKVAARPPLKGKFNHV